MTQVCIAGMHRSGTSMVARLLNLCGLYLGHESDISITAADNPEGFWENYHFVQLNDAILSGLGGAWDMPPVLQKGWETEPSSLAHQAAAEELIGQFTDCEAWGWKDPRNSLTIDLWRKVLPKLKVIICLRNPLEVVQSLSKRGYSSTAFGFNLWFAYNAHLVETIPPEARIITHYEAYFSDPRAELERLLEFTGIEASEEQIRAALKSINRPLRHNRVKFLDLLDEHPDLEVVKLYQDMCLQAGPVSQKLAAESQVVTDISRGEYEQYIINRQRERLADRLAAAQSQLAAQDQKIRLLTSQIEEDRRAYQARMEEDRRAYQARMDEENQAYRDLWARTQHLQGLVQRLRREINQMQATRAFRLISRYRSFRDRLRSTAANIFLNNPSALDRPSQKPASELQAAPARPSPATPPPPA